MLTQAKLKSLLNYNPVTGVFTNLTSRSSNSQKYKTAGTIATRKNKKYLVIQLNNKLYLAHRLAFLYINGHFPKNEIDHIDGDGTNNKFSNLRDITHAENMMNRLIPSNNSSGLIGVSWSKARNKWVAQIKINNKSINLGRFINFNDAVLARACANEKYNFTQVK